MDHQNGSEDEEDRSVPYLFPNDDPIRYTLQVFPQSAAVKDAAGAPWACCVSPFLDAETLYGDERRAPSPVSIDDVARCEECFAYISPFSLFSSRHWKCALCGHQSRFTPALSRYRRSNAFDVLPELSQETMEYELPLDSKGAMMRSGEVMLEPGYLVKDPASARPIVYLAVVDEGGDREYHDAIAEILDTCVKTLPDDARFGLVTVSDRVGLMDLTAPLPHIQFVDLGVSSSFNPGAEGGGGSKPRDHWPDPANIVALSDVMSLEELMCPLRGNRERISANVRGLRGACGVSPGPKISSNGQAQEHLKDRAVGLAVKLLLDLVLQAGPNVATAAAAAAYSSSANPGRVGKWSPAVERSRGFQIAGGRLMLFLAGAPNRGPGAVSPTPHEVDWGDGGGSGEGDPDLHDYFFRGEPRALGFYRGQAYRAASSGVSVDVHCFASKSCNHFGLSSIAPLAMTTGGGLFRHSLLHQQEGEKRAAHIAREVQHELLQPRVYDGLLRIRTSSECCVNRNGVYGNLSADPRLEDLWHVASCASAQAFSMDFEYRATGVAGLEVDNRDLVATVQSAFAFTAVVPDTAAAARAQGRGQATNSNGDNDADTPLRMVTVRRLRVSTSRTASSSRVEEVAGMADPATVAGVLAHKVVSEARRSGFMEARALLRDWLSNFVYGLARMLPIPDGANDSGNGGVGGAGEGDASRVLSHPRVVGMARLVFGLLQSPLLHPTRGVPDERISLLSRLSALDPDSLSIVLYPEMQGYATPDVRMANNLSLSRETVKSASSSCRVFVIDTFWRVIVHYVDTPETMAASAAAAGSGDAPLSFPPPAHSAIGQYLAMRRSVRPMAGQEVVYSRPDTPEAFFFEEAMLEDRPLPKSEKSQTFSEFFAELKRDALQEHIE